MIKFLTETKLDAFLEQPDATAIVLENDKSIGACLIATRKGDSLTKLTRNCKKVL